MRLVRCDVKAYPPRQVETGDGYRIMQNDPRPPLTFVHVSFDERELWDMRSDAAVFAYVREAACISTVHEVTVEHDMMRRSVELYGVLDTAIAAIEGNRIVRREVVAPSGAAAQTAATVQPVAKPARRRLQL